MKSSFVWKCGALALVLCIPLGAAQADFTTLYSFKGASDGSYPEGKLLLDKQGNLYGTTFAGGSHDHGIVFEIAPDGTETVLHVFSGKNDGANPAAGLLAGKRGTLYGTTVYGGSDCDCGTVFQLAREGSETILHVFAGGPDGARPTGRLIRDNAGNFYGTTIFGGEGCEDCGTVFRLQPTGAETVLHAFSGRDGLNPSGDLIKDEAGNLYGVAQFGGKGSCACGTVFMVDPAGKATVLHTFKGSDGAYPHDGLIRDDAGNLYGVTSYGGGGTCGFCGAVFRLAPDGAETVLYAFKGGIDGELPTARLTRDASGDLYGATYAGGGGHCYWGRIKGCGTIFKIAPDNTETILHAFRRDDGARPVGGLIQDANGNLYGTTSRGGAADSGTVFRLN